MNDQDVEISTPGKIRIAFVITGLGIGGAEMMLLKLLATIDRRRYECTVVSLSDRIELVEELERLAIPVNVIGSRAWYSLPKALAGLVGHLRRIQPHIVQGWMYHGSFASTLASFFLGRKVPVIWNIRAASVSPQLQRFRTRALIGASRWFANQPAAILNNSLASAAFHEKAFGYPAHTTRVIPNGFDPDRFKPDGEVRQRVRAELTVPKDALLVGLVARLDPAKDHGTFLRAASELSREFPNVYFLLIGTGITSENIAAICEGEPPLPQHRLILRHPRSDIEAIHQALDVEVLSSRSEGFPNSIGEAMACGVPCVATDVGDCAYLLGDAGRIVPKENPVALAAAIRELCQLSAADRNRLGQAARQRIIDSFSMPVVARAYEACFEDVVAAKGQESCAV